MEKSNFAVPFILGELKEPIEIPKRPIREPNAAFIGFLLTKTTIIIIIREIENIDNMIINNLSNVSLLIYLLFHFLYETLLFQT